MAGEKDGSDNSELRSRAPTCNCLQINWEGLAAMSTMEEASLERGRSLCRAVGTSLGLSRESVADIRQLAYRIGSICNPVGISISGYCV